MPTGLGTEIQWYSPTVGGGAVNADDQSGNGNHGTLAQASAGGEQMAVTAETGAGGTHAFDFNNANRAYVQVPSQVNNGLVGVSFWANLTQTNANKVLVIDCTNTTTGDGSGGLFLRTSGGKINFFCGDGDWETSAFNSTDTVPTNTWFHCVVQQNGTDTEVYIDGVASGVTTAGDNPWAADSGHAIASLGSDGRSGAANQFTLERYMDDIRFHNRTLAAGEIRHLATERGVLGAPPHLAGSTDTGGFQQSGSTIDIDVPSQTQEGDLLVLITYRNDVPTTGSPTIGIPTGFEPYMQFGEVEGTVISYRYATGSEPATYTATANNNQIALNMLCFRNVDQTCPFNTRVPQSTNPASTDHVMQGVASAENELVALRILSCRDDAVIVCPSEVDEVFQARQTTSSDLTASTSVDKVHYESGESVPDLTFQTTTIADDGTPISETMEGVTILVNGTGASNMTDTSVTLVGNEPFSGKVNGVSQAVPSGTAVGDLLVCVCITRLNNTLPPFAGFTEELHDAGPSTQFSTVSWKIADASDVSGLTHTNSTAGAATGYLLSFRDFDAPNPLGSIAINAETVNSTDINYPAVAQNANGTTVRCYFENDDVIDEEHFTRHNRANDLGHTLNSTGAPDQLVRLTVEPMTYNDGTLPARDENDIGNSFDRRTMCVFSVNPDGAPPPPPPSGFYDPFNNKTFNPNYTRRIG